MKCACVQSYVSTERVERKIGPDELMRCAKPITVATAKAVAAGNSGRQEDVIAAANVGRKAVFDLLRACKVSLEQPPCEYLESQKLLLSCFCQQPFTVKKVHLDFFYYTCQWRSIFVGKSIGFLEPGSATWSSSCRRYVLSECPVVFFCTQECTFLKG